MLDANVGFFFGGASILVNHHADGGFNLNWDDINFGFGPGFNNGGVSVLVSPEVVQDDRWYWEGGGGYFGLGAAVGTAMDTSFGPRTHGTTYWQAGFTTPGAGILAYYV